MLIYGYRGKKCPTSTNFYTSQKNVIALYNYNQDLFNKCGNQELLLKHVYLSYSTLERFNSSLVNTYEVNEDYISSLDFVKEYLEDNQDIENSIDSKCRSIYDHLKIWYKRLTNNSQSLDGIKWEVVMTMKYYEKQGIYTISSINLKRNYYDFVI